MKSLNLFTRLFTAIVLLTMGSLGLAIYSAKRAYDADPQLISKIEKQFDIHINNRNGFYVSTLSNRDSSQDTWQMPLTQKKIRIKTFSGRVAIKNTSSTEVHISANGRLDKSISPKLLDINSTANVLTILEPEKGVSDLEIHIEIPSSFAYELAIESVSADVSVESLSPNSISIETASGEILLDTIKADSLSLATISGDTHIHTSAITTLAAKTVSGGIKIENKGTAITRLKSISGDIDLKLPPSESFRFDLKTVSGGIKNEHHEQAKAVATVEISTTSGDIKIE